MTESKVHTISVQELNKRRTTTPHLCLIDVREDYEWEEGHIPGALHIPKDELVAKKKKIPGKDQPIYLHCRGGVRSLHAANSLADLGYKEVYSIDGGIMDWAKAGYPIEV